MIQCKSAENRIRRQAKNIGYIVRKPRKRNCDFYNQGKYMLIDIEWNTIAVGDKFDASLNDIDHYLSKCNESIVVCNNSRLTAGSMKD